VVFCNEFCSVIEALGHQYDPIEWRLFDSSKVGLKAVFLPSGKKFQPVHLVHVADMTESCENSKLLLEKIQ